MARKTKEALASALRQMMAVKPVDKVTVKDIVEVCGVNRQTFYYHFDDVDELLEWIFEQDSDRVFPREVVRERWLDDMMNYLIGILSQCVNGADPATCEPVSADGECTGSCSTCGGCG